MGTADETHLRVQFRFADGDPELRFVDQRTLRPVGGGPGGRRARTGRAHRAGPLDPEVDVEAVVSALRRRLTGLKRALLDQTLVSGIGNIYADEALWRARLHWARPTAALTRPQARTVLGAAAEAMTEAVRADCPGGPPAVR